MNHQSSPESPHDISANSLLPPLPEETSQQFSRLVAQKTLLHLHLVIELGVVEHGKYRPGRARFEIGGGKDQTVEPGMNHGPGAHGTRLQRHI